MFSVPPNCIAFSQEDLCFIEMTGPSVVRFDVCRPRLILQDAICSEVGYMKSLKCSFMVGTSSD